MVSGRKQEMRVKEAYSDIAADALNGGAIRGVRARECTRASSGRASRALAACAEVVECHVVDATYRKMSVILSV